jgi:hypothetical protein
VQNILVEDDGIGFTTANFDSFNTSDTTTKREIGGRGIGRFAWLKAFDRAEVRSVFIDENQAKVRTFRFVLPHGVDGEAISAAVANAPRRTAVRLVAARLRYANEIPKKADVIARWIIEHCLDYFVVSETPHIVIQDAGYDAIDLNHLYASEVRRSSSSETFEVAGKALQAMHMLVAARGGLGHRIHFCANRRVVRSEALDRYLVDLDEPLQPPDAPAGARGYFYAGYISGSYLDETVTPDRTDFFIARGNDLLGDGEARWPELVDACVRRVQAHLAPLTDPGQCAGRPHTAGSLIPHAGPIRALVIPMIEPSFRARPMAATGRADRGVPGGRTTGRRTIGVAAITRGADREEAVAAPAGFLAKRRIHDVGAAARSDWTRRLLPWHKRGRLARSVGASRRSPRA